MNSAVLDTSTMDINIDKLKNYSLALYAGSQKTKEIRTSISESLPVAFKILVHWIDESQNNLKAAKQMAGDMSYFSSLDELQSIKLKDTLDSEITILTRQLINFSPIQRTSDTRALAQQVINQGSDQASIEEWASVLANDISQGND